MNHDKQKKSATQLSGELPVGLVVIMIKSVNVHVRIWDYGHGMVNYI